MWPNDLLKEPLGLELKKKYKRVFSAAQQPVAVPTLAPVAASDSLTAPAVQVSQNIYGLIERMDYSRAAKEIAQDFFKPTSRYRPQLEAEIKFILERSGGVVIPMPTQQQLPLMLRHYHLKGTQQSKVFYYLLWYMSNVEKRGGSFSIVQCLNGPYQGEYFARLDEAMRVNVIWAWSTTSPQIRDGSLALGQNPKKETFALNREGVWKELGSLRFENLPPEVLSVVDEGFSFRADLHPYPILLPDGCRGTAEEFVKCTWSLQHLSHRAVSATGDVPCVCPEPCNHPPMGSMNSREHIVPLLSDPNNPFSQHLPHSRCLCGEKFWTEHLSDNPYDNWHNAIAYTVSKVYTY